MAQDGARSPRPPRRSSVAQYSATVDDVVWVGSRRVQGIVRFVGTTDFAAGEWLGVELGEASGKNDGSVYGKRYFDCQPSRGIFMKQSALKSRALNGSYAAPFVEFDTQAKGRKLQAEASPAASSRATTPSTRFASTGCSGSPQNWPTSPTSAWTAGLASPRYTEAEQGARRALAEAAEEHDVAALKAAIRQAQVVGLPPAELEGPWSILQFELQRRVLEDLDGVDKQVVRLEAQVAAAQEAVRRSAPQEFDLDSSESSVWLNEVAARVEERVWARLGQRVNELADRIIGPTDEKIDRSMEEFRTAMAQFEAMLQDQPLELDACQAYRPEVQDMDGKARRPQFDEVGDEDGLMRYAWGLALLDVSGNKDTVLGKASEADDFASMSTAEVDSRDQVTPPHDFRSPRSAATTPRREDGLFDDRLGISQDG